MNKETKMLDQVFSLDRIAMITAYEFCTARIFEQAGVDIILVGDSLAMVFQGKQETRNATLEEMLYHTRAVVRGAERTPIVSDMPANSYSTPEMAVENAGKFFEAGAHMVKIEGFLPEVVQALLENKMPVMGHLGLLPQTAENYRVVGKNPEDAERVLEEAKNLDRLGIPAIVLECVPLSLARRITDETTCKTIGIGAGMYCDGQVLVANDLLGLYDRKMPKFVRKYADLSQVIRQAAEKYASDVRSGLFPGDEESYH